MFSNPLTIEPFTQNKILKKSIFSFIDSLVNSFYNKEYLDKFINNCFTNKNDKLNIVSSSIQFKIIIPTSKINVFTDNYIIPETHWNITILIGNKD